MAGRKSIGTLVASIEADSSGFTRTLADTEKTLTAFAKKAASPLTFALGAGAGVGGILGSPEAFLKPLSQVANVLGGGKYGELLNPETATKKFTEFKDEMVNLGRESRKFGLDPQFLLGFQKMAGPDSEAATKSLNRLMLNVGSGSDAMVSQLEKWGLSWQELRASKPEEMLGKIADAYAALDDPLDKAAMRFDLAGKSAASLHKILGGGKAAINEYVENIKKLGIGTSDQIALSELVNKIEKEEKTKFLGYSAKAFERYGAAELMAAQKREAAPLFSGDYLEGLGLTALTWKAKLFGGSAPIPPERFNEYRKLLADLNKPKPNAEEIASRLAAEQQAAEYERMLQTIDAATGALDKMNEDLDEQARLLRYTEDGWAGFEKQMRAIDKAITDSKGAGLEKGLALIERLGGLRDKKREEEEGKTAEQIMARIRGAGTGGPLYAQAALSGSQEFAHAYAGGMGDQMQNLVLTVEQILELMKKPAVSPELERNVAEAARLLRNGDVKVLRPNP